MTGMNRLYLFITTLVVSILLAGMVTYMFHVETVLKMQSETIECIYEDQKELDNSGKEVYNKYMELNNEIITTKERLEEVSRGKLEMEVEVSFYTINDDGMNGRGITTSGTIARAGRTIAAPDNIPFGTKMSIDGIEYSVEDRGGSIIGNRIDILVDTKDEALRRGRYITKAIIKRR